MPAPRQGCAPPNPGFQGLRHLGPAEPKEQLPGPGLLGELSGDDLSSQDSFPLVRGPQERRPVAL